MKAEHLKTQADEAVRQGNFGVAVQKCASQHTALVDDGCADGACCAGTRSA